MLKATIIYYSTTGNTAYVGYLIGDELKKNFNVDSEYFDGIEIIKALKLGRKTENESPLKEDAPVLVKLRNCLKQSDIIGVGAFAYYFSCGCGFTDIFSKPNILPTDVFSNIRYIFGFGTMGGMMGDAVNMVVTEAHNRCGFAKFIGSIEVKTPDNFAFYLPEKGKRDLWDEKEIDKVREFSGVIGNRIVGKDTSSPVAYKKTPFAMNERYLDSPNRLGKIILDVNACVKCGTCVETCPYGAISFVDGSPVFNHDACRGCSRCFNKCPKDAINFANVPRSELRMRHPFPFISRGTWTSLDGSIEKGMKVVGIPLPDGATLMARMEK